LGVCEKKDDFGRGIRKMNLRGRKSVEGRDVKTDLI